MLTGKWSWEQQPEDRELNADLSLLCRLDLVLESAGAKVSRKAAKLSSPQPMSNNFDPMLSNTFIPPWVLNRLQAFSGRRLVEKDVLSRACSKCQCVSSLELVIARSRNLSVVDVGAVARFKIDQEGLDAFLPVAKSIGGNCLAELDDCMLLGA